MYLNQKRIILKRGAHCTLFVFGDTQKGAEGYKKEMWQEFVHDFKTTPNAYALGLGDYGDFLRPSLRCKVAEVLQQDGDARTQLDNIVRKKIDEIADEMMFMKGKIISMHSGHHEWDFKDGTNSSQYLCNVLDSTYLGWSGYTVLKFQGEESKNGSKGNGMAVKIYSTHGDGGSPFSSGDLAQLEKKIAPYWVADLYLRGHSSKGEMAPIELNDVMIRGTLRFIKKTRWIVNVPGMMNGYVEKHTSYVEYKNMPPACLGYAKIDFNHSNFRTLSDDGKQVTGLKMQPIIVSPHVYGNNG